MAEGRIKWYNPKKGYGFIASEEVGEIFVHNSGIKEFGFFGFQEDDKVTFEVRETQRGKQAVNVRAVKAYK
ncbi:MAG: cold shock domain-containing protein [Desulfobacteraceae bacterium]|jgi:CspA family cold shock protein|nr:MAG: cold shock domain-containing protein [Desulfobacteraceae bacterium]